MTDSDIRNSCGRITIDVNGAKKRRNLGMMLLDCLFGLIGLIGMFMELIVCSAYCQAESLSIIML